MTKRKTGDVPKLKPGRKATESRTSHAKAKRLKNGLQPAPDPKQQAKGHATELASKASLMPPETRSIIAKAIAASPGSKDGVMAVVVKKQQELMKMLQENITSAAPRAANYLVDLVDGLHEAAPHAVRMGAASKIIDTAREFHANSAGSKDLSEMTAAELEAELNALGNALASRTAEDAEVIEQEPEPARPGKRALE
jgi:hypothetical protein